MKDGTAQLKYFTWKLANSTMNLRTEKCHKLVFKISARENF